MDTKQAEENKKAREYFLDKILTHNPKYCAVDMCYPKDVIDALTEFSSLQNKELSSQLEEREKQLQSLREAVLRYLKEYLPPYDRMLNTMTQNLVDAVNADYDGKEWVLTSNKPEETNNG